MFRPVFDVMFIVRVQGKKHSAVMIKSEPQFCSLPSFLLKSEQMSQNQERGAKIKYHQTHSTQTRVFTGWCGMLPYVAKITFQTQQQCLALFAQRF